MIPYVEILLLVVVAVMSVLAYLNLRTLGRLLEDRHVAFDKQTKQRSRDLARALQDVDAALAESRALRDEALVAHRRLEQHLSHPTVKRLTSGG